MLLTLGIALAIPTGDAPHRRRLLAWSTTFCYPDGNLSLSIPDSKCAGGVPQDIELCSATSTEPSTCELADGVLGRGIDANRWDSDYIFKYCPTRLVFEFADGSQRAFCEDLQAVPAPNDWATTRRASESRPYEAYTDSWWPWARCQADWGRSWVGGKCIDDTRYLGEKCADELECDNSGVAQYDGLHLSCAPPSATNLAITEPTCLPSAFLLDVERNRCECNDWWRFDWNFGFACGAKDGFCNGHACVLSTGDGNKYCDYQTDNSW